MDAETAAAADDEFEGPGAVAAGNVAVAAPRTCSW